ncbi:recombination protein NinG [Roseateles sp.]|uniref:recombination protein NinG n=1 Tax=Roseateles sp. TaxID=1971397 RepID=UPI0031DF556F
MAEAHDGRKQTRAKLEALKPLKELKKEAQAAFNRYIRLRDRRAGHGCICCGAPLEWESSMPGGTKRDQFRAGMVARWGEAVVADLEGPHPTPHLKHDDYRQIRDTYKLKARALEKEAANDSTPFKQIA